MHQGKDKERAPRPIPGGPVCSRTAPHKERGEDEVFRALGLRVGANLFRSTYSNSPGTNLNYIHKIPSLARAIHVGYY